VNSGTVAARVVAKSDANGSGMVKSKKRKIDEVSEISLEKGRKIDLRAIESKKQTIILQNPPSQIQETTTTVPAKNSIITTKPDLKKKRTIRK